MPPHLAEIQIVVEAAPGMEMNVDGSGAAAGHEQHGQRVLVTRRRSSAASRGMKELMITLSRNPDAS